MFEKLKNKFLELQKSFETRKEDLNLEQFNDPLAFEIDWSPLKSGGANFKTSDLKKISSSQYRYQLSKGGKLFLGLFAFIGLGILTVVLFMAMNGNFSNLIFLGIMGLVFTLVSFFLYKFLATPITFDGSLGMIWKGKHPPKLSGNQQDNDDLVYFNDVHALQILSERVRSKNGSYLSYEINLVLNNGKRVNVVDHGKLSQIIIDADTISQFMSKPIWDIT